MCENASWVEKDGEVLFLDDDDLQSNRGRELKMYLGYAYDEDKKGHGAIVWYYPSSKDWTHKECTDFSDPKNFPDELAQKIKDGKRSLFGNIEKPEQMLNKYGLKKLADRQKAYANRQKAYADWQKADADWQKADADWQKAYADWQKAYADWQKAYADWQKADAKVFWEIFADKKNRVKCWR